MGQIFNRLKRISSSHINDNEENLLSHIYSNDTKSDDKLKEMIDNLGKEKTQDIKSNNSKLFDSYQILDISKDASNSEIKEAYLKKIKEYHPDKTANLGKELQDLAEKKSKQINLAYQQIKKRRKDDEVA